MKYLKRFKPTEAVVEISKEKARFYLEGCWKDEFLDDIFQNDKAFRLFTPYSEIWTMTEDGKVPMPGFYGTVG